MDIKSDEVLGMRIDVTDYSEATATIQQWAARRESRYVCAPSVHTVMESHDAADFRNIMNGADLVVPDGMPLVWALKLRGRAHATRVYGPNLTLHVCQAAAQQRLPIALYGGTSESLEAFVQFLQRSFPGIEIVCRIAPPFRPLTEEEDRAYTEQLAASGARIVFVGIGCPKQERWMAQHRGKIPAVMVGVGAAFDFHSGRVRQAPPWLQRLGMEWFFRLLMEPRRLWRRYLYNNPRFVGLLLAQLLGARLY